MKVNAFVCILMMSLSLSAFPGHGKEGGDGVVTSDGAIRLRDLVDPGNCTWRSGKTILAQTELNDIIEKLNDANPYLSYFLKDQINRIRWCFTTTLKKINTNDDEESLTYYLDPYASNKIQAGIRVVNNVYIDQGLLASDLTGGRMSKDDRPYFYIHEAMHALLYMKTPFRNKRVREAVKAIRDFYVGHTNADDLESMIVGSGLLVPENNSQIQNLVNILNNDRLTVSERVGLAQPVLNPGNRNQINEDWKLLDSYFSDKELTALTEKTGLTRYEFLMRTRKDIILRDDNLPQFEESYSEWILNIPFGKCISETNDLRNRLGTHNLAGIFTYMRGEPGYYWLTVKDKNTNQVIKRFDRYPIYPFLPEREQTHFIYKSDKATQDILQSFFYDSLCDFTPMN